MSSSSSPPTYLVGVTIATCGQDKENLGSDEADIIAISWICIDTRDQAKVSEERDYVSYIYFDIDNRYIRSISFTGRYRCDQLGFG